MYPLRLRAFFFAFVLCLAAWGIPAAPVTAASEPGSPTAQIESFYAALLDTMKQGKELGMEGRYKKLTPAIEQVLDLPAMTAFAVGTTWPNIPADKQAALIDAFKYMTVATYARNFSSYNGERFEVDPNVQTRNDRRVVRTNLIQKGKDPVSLSYLMRQNGPVWKVIDVYYLGTISQLAARRSEFSATLKSGGPDALTQKLRELGNRLMTGA